MMRTKRRSMMLVFVTALFLSSVAQAGVVEDFESYTGLPITADSTAAWTGWAYPESSNIIVEGSTDNQIIDFEYHSDSLRVSAGRPLGSGNSIADGETKIFFIRFYNTGTGNEATIEAGMDIAWGLTDYDSGTGYANICSPVGMLDGAFFAKNGGTTLTLVNAATMNINQWYNLWMVVDNTTNTSKFYMNQGTADATEANRLSWTDGSNVIDTFNFRRNPNTEAIDQFCAYGELDGQLRFDDLYILEGETLFNPTNPCFNVAPAVSFDESGISTLVNTPITIGITVTDDGKPYQEGCPPTGGTPWGLTYKWTQLDGPGTAVITDDEAEDAQVTFPVRGDYVMQVSVKDAPDAYIGEGLHDGRETLATVVVRVIDPTLDYILMAHWNMEEGSGTTVDDVTVNSNVGAFGGTGTNGDPTWISGHLTGQPTNKALQFHGVDTSGNGRVVFVTESSVTDPNISVDLYSGITVASWIKIDSYNDMATVDGHILYKDPTAWRMGFHHIDHVIRFSMNNPTGNVERVDTDSPTYGLYAFDDTYWHHVAVTFDGADLKCYVDGILWDTTTVGATFGSVISSGTGNQIAIGGRTDLSNGGESFNGGIDDVRVYSYPLTQTQIAALVAASSLVPTVYAGPDVTYKKSINPLQLDATVWDDAGGYYSTWEKVSGPGTVGFGNISAIDTTASFSEVGVYELKLTVVDSEFSKSDTITVTVNQPTCAEVIADDLLLVGDVSGPLGTPDCQVDLYDFAAFAANWLKCNDPEDVNCDSPY